MKIKLSFFLIILSIITNATVYAYQFKLVTKNMRNYSMNEVVVRCRDAIATPTQILLPANDTQGQVISFNSEDSLTCQLLIDPNGKRIGIAIKDDYVFSHDISLIVTNCPGCQYDRYLGAATKATVTIY